MYVAAEFLRWSVNRNWKVKLCLKGTHTDKKRGFNNWRKNRPVWTSAFRSSLFVHYRIAWVAKKSTYIVQPNLHLAEHRKKSFQFLASLWKCSRQHGRVRISQDLNSEPILVQFDQKVLSQSWLEITNLFILTQESKMSLKCALIRL